jgi:hypothetical protein
VKEDILLPVPLKWNAKSWWVDTQTLFLKSCLSFIYFTFHCHPGSDINVQ